MGCQMKSNTSFWRHQGSFHRRDEKLVKNAWNHHSRKKRKDVSEKGTTYANRGKCKKSTATLSDKWFRCPGGREWMLHYILCVQTPQSAWSTERIT